MVCFSVVIPMFNASAHIVRTLESVVHQTFLPIEIIIVDDFSDDDSLRIVKRWRENYSGPIQIIIEPLKTNSGPSIARNVGWEIATGDYVAFLDADDRFLSHKLEQIVPILRDNSDIVLLGHASAIKENTISESNELKRVTVNDLLLKNLFTTPSVIVKRTIDERFDESMRYTEDHDLWLRVTQRYDKTYYLDKVLTIIDRPVRSVGGQSSNVWAMRKGEIKMYWKYCKANGLMVLFPMFFGYSLAKHGFKLLKGRS